MLSRRIAAAARPLSRAASTPRTSVFSSLQQARLASTARPNVPIAEVEDDPGMNGNYPNPLPQKREHRDPYGDWWDKQERRNFGEPLHEDNDILGIFAPAAYTHYKPGFGAVLLGSWIGCVFALMGVVALTYPDKPSAPRTFVDGLEAELGGKGALAARRDDTDI